MKLILLFASFILSTFARKNQETFEETLEKNHDKCTSRSMKNMILTEDNLISNDIGGLKSKFCGDPETSECNNDDCCGTAKMEFVDVFPTSDDDPIHLIVQNLTEYLPRKTIPSPPNGIATAGGDLPQINIATNSQTEFSFSFEADGKTKVVDLFDFTFFDIDSGLENAVETITVCSSGIVSFFLEETTLVDVTVDEANECVSFTSTVSGFVENNPTNSTDALLLVRQLAATVRFQAISNFKVTFEVMDGPTDAGRNFLFAGVPFLSPEICPQKKISWLPKRCRNILGDNAECSVEDEDSDSESDSDSDSDDNRNNKNSRGQSSKSVKTNSKWWCKKEKFSFRW